MNSSFILNENTMKTTIDFDTEKNEKKLLKFRKEILQWINELEFIKDERIFLEHLLGSHFLDLSTPKLYEPTKELIQDLKKVENRGNELLVTIKIHKKHIVTLIEQTGFIEKIEIKKEHNKIKMEFGNYVLNFRVVKKYIFDMIKEIMKKNKQKILIKKQ
jgi:hypothetical protein